MEEETPGQKRALMLLVRSITAEVVGYLEKNEANQRRIPREKLEATIGEFIRSICEHHPAFIYLCECCAKEDDFKLEDDHVDEFEIIHSLRFRVLTEVQFELPEILKQMQLKLPGLAEALDLLLEFHTVCEADTGGDPLSLWMDSEFMPYTTGAEGDSILDFECPLFRRDFIGVKKDYLPTPTGGNYSGKIQRSANDWLNRTNVLHDLEFPPGVLEDARGHNYAFPGCENVYRTWDLLQDVRHALSGKLVSTVRESERAGE